MCHLWSQPIADQYISAETYVAPKAELSGSLERKLEELYDQLPSSGIKAWRKSPEGKAVAAAHALSSVSGVITTDHSSLIFLYSGLLLDEYLDVMQRVGSVISARSAETFMEFATIHPKQATAALGVFLQRVREWEVRTQKRIIHATTGRYEPTEDEVFQAEAAGRWAVAKGKEILCNHDGDFGKWVTKALAEHQPSPLRTDPGPRTYAGRGA